MSRSLQNKPGTAAYRPPSQLRGGATSLDDTADHELEPSDDEVCNVHNPRLQALQETLDDLSIGHRFFGKSSGANLVQTALDLKSEYNGDQDHFTLANRRPEFWNQHSVCVPLILDRCALYPAHSTKKKQVGTLFPPARPASLHVSRARSDRTASRALLLPNQPFLPAPAPPNL